MIKTRRKLVAVSSPPVIRITRDNVGQERVVRIFAPEYDYSSENDRIERDGHVGGPITVRVDGRNVKRARLPAARTTGLDARPPSRFVGETKTGYW